jgi:hypothetical protein
MAAVSAATAAACQILLIVACPAIYVVVRHRHSHCRRRCHAFATTVCPHRRCHSPCCPCTCPFRCPPASSPSPSPTLSPSPLLARHPRCHCSCRRHHHPLHCTTPSWRPCFGHHCHHCLSLSAVATATTNAKVSIAITVNAATATSIFTDVSLRFCHYPHHRFAALYLIVV